MQFRYLKGNNTFLVKMAPKSSLPAHEHKYNEQCLMLEGSVSVDGQTAYAGDFVFMPAGTFSPPSTMRHNGSHRTPSSAA